MAPLKLAALESFYVPGHEVELEYAPGVMDRTLVGSMYVQRLVPEERTFPWPVVLVHGGCHTGVTWETTPDGREGWANLLVRQGFEVLNVDQPWRGRSAPDLRPGALAGENLHIAGSGSTELFMRGPRFPAGRSAAYRAQLCADFGVASAMERGHPGLCDPRAIPPLVELLDRVGPVAMITHSQGGQVGWLAALARPTLVKAIVAVEPGVFVSDLENPEFPRIPVQILWGDNLPEQAIALTTKDLAASRRLAREHAHIEVDSLPDAGIRGNGHMLMMEDNSAELLDRVAFWLRDRAG